MRGKSIFVDLGGKSEGVLAVAEFEGDHAAARLVHRGDGRTLRPGRRPPAAPAKGSAIDADWETLRKGVIVEARVTKAVKGGLEVDVDGIRGFLPISQLDLSRVEDASSYINQKFKALVTEANQREKNLVVSRRELLEQERAEQRETPGRRSRKARFTRESCVRSRASAPSSTSAASTACCRSAR